MEQKKTVLIVEDEKNIVDIIRFNLQRTGYDTLEAYDGEAGLAMAREKKPDLILLDVMMPKMMGFDVCRALRAEGDNVPVIILTAREEEEDKILGLEIGADDYITKPFSMRELLARVKANIRRTTMLSAPAAEDNAMSAGGGITINTDSFQVRKNGVPIDLTQREYELLTFLASHPGKVFSRVDLMEQVWNYGYVGDDARTVDVTVRRLREKIEADPSHPNYLLTVRGLGYRLSREPGEYTLGEILRLTEGSLAPVACLECGAKPCPRAANCPTLPVWSELDKRISGYLDSVTLADLVKK